MKVIVNKCVICKKYRKNLDAQVMGPLPMERLRPAPAWYTTHMDYFGPFELKGEVNKRVCGKGYGIIFTCPVSRAIHLDIEGNYNSDELKLVLRRFVSIRGYPKKIHSDKGSQLVAVSKELKNIIKQFDEDTLKAFGANSGLEWDFSPASAPWMNGCGESLIKSVKKAILQTIGSQILRFSEMQTVLYEIANLINERPIGRHPTEPNEGCYLSPNDLLLGRASSKVPAGPFHEQTTSRQRHEFVQSIVNLFWKKWTRNYFPSLINRQKWHTEKRDIKVNDIVFVQDSNAVRGQWILAKVCKVFPSSDGHVRKCELLYNLPSSSVTEHTPCKRLERPAHKLIVLVPSDEIDPA